MGLAFIPVYIRYLGVEAWGLVGFMSMLQAWFTLLDMGLTPTLSREMARFLAGAHTAQSIRNLLRSLEIIYGGVAVTVVGVVWLIAPWIAAHWLGASKLSLASIMQAISIMGFVLAMRMVEQVYRGAIQGLQRQVWLNGAQSVLATLRWAGAVGVLVWVVPSIEAFFLWQGLVSLLTVVIFARQTYRWLPNGERAACFDLAAVVGVRSFAGGMAATALLSIMLTQVDKLMLSRLVSLEDFGYYTLAATGSSSLYFLASPISSALFPRLTELVAKKEQILLIEAYHRTSQGLATVLVPSALIIAVFSEPLLYVWTGNIKLSQQVAPLLALLTLGTMCNCFMHVPYTTQLAYGWTGLTVRINIVAVCVIVPAILWAVPRFGAIGAAWAWFVLNVSYVLISIHFMHARILPNEKWSWYWESVFKPLFIGSITVLALHRWILLPQGRAMTAVVLVGISILLAIVVLCCMPTARKFLQQQLKLE